MNVNITRGFVVGTAVLLGASGCATKKYVQREVGEVNTKTATLTTEVEKTQERLTRSETRIDEVNREAQAGKVQASEAMAKAVDAERAAKGKLLYQVTLTDDQLKFPFGKAVINEDGQASVDQAIAAIKQENKGVFVEIEGHTDSTGPEQYNHELGEKRALAVRDYLHEQHGIALSRLEVISYGERQPVTDNKTRDHRAENRRVVIKVLE